MVGETLGEREETEKTTNHCSTHIIMKIAIRSVHPTFPSYALLSKYFLPLCLFIHYNVQLQATVPLNALLHATLSPTKHALTSRIPS